MTAIADLASLKAAVASALVRSDFNQKIADSVPLAEAWLNRSLRLRLMEEEAILVATPGAPSVSLPANFLEPLSLSFASGGAVPLLMRGGDQVSTRDFGKPSAYWIAGDAIVFDRFCDEAYKFNLRMLKRIALLAEGESNALLDAWPDLYFLAVLVAVCAVYLADDPRLALWKAGRDAALAEVMRKEARAKALVRLCVEPPIVPNFARDIQNSPFQET